MIEVAKAIEVARHSSGELKEGTVLNANASGAQLQKKCEKICKKNRKKRQKALGKY